MTIEKLGIRESLLQRLRENGAVIAADRSHPPLPTPGGFTLPELPKGVGGARGLAKDYATASALSWMNMNTSWGRTGFPGYPYLAELWQISEYRALSEAPAGEMVRKWIKLTSSDTSGDATDRIKRIEREMKRLKARRRFQQAAILDGAYGRGQLFLDLGIRGNAEPDKVLLDVPEKIAKGSLRSLKVIEPIVTAPADYNATDPTHDDYYKPSAWWLLGKKVHASRLLTFVSRPVPDLLKPAYNFGGMSMSQLAMDCVRNWRRVRDSTTRMVESFSTSGIKTAMSDVLTGAGSEQLVKRAEMFANMRDNFGTLLIDKANEEFFQFNVPLSGLDKLQAQAQEHMAAVGRIPLVVLLGITPSGLNASSEGEIQVFYDYIKEQQELLFRDNLERLIRIIQLSLFGDVDDSISFEFEALWQLDDEALARIRKSDADAATAYVDLGAVAPIEVRKRLAADQNSGWQGLDVGGGASSLLDPEEEPEEPAAGPVVPPAAAAVPASPAAPAAPARPKAPLMPPGTSAAASDQVPRRHRPARRR